MRLELPQIPSTIAVVLVALGVTTCDRHPAVSSSRRASVQQAEAVAQAPTSSGSDAPTDQSPLALGPGVSPPILLKRGPWEYPNEPTRHVEGTVIVEAVVDPRGEVAQVRLVRKLRPDVDAAVLQYVRHCRYKPASKDGKVVAVVIPVTVTFKFAP